MSKRLVLLFCVLFAVAFAVPAFAAVQNVKVSGDILARQITRNNFDLTKGDGTVGEDEISVFNSVVRLRVDADLTDNVSTVVRLINERNWDSNEALNDVNLQSGEKTINDDTNTDIDLDLAYVTMKEFLYSPLTLTVGRQELHFGNDMIIGDGVGAPARLFVSGGVGTNQTTNYMEATGYGGVNGDLAYRKAFDAVRATLNYDPLVIDVVMAKLEENRVREGESADDIDVYGINAAYKFSDKWGTMAETYYWAKINSNNECSDISGVTQSPKSDQVHTFGARVSTMPMKTLNLQQEIAWQGGRKWLSATPTLGATRDRNAWAAQSLIMYMPKIKYDPTFGLIYSYFSGDASLTNTDPNKEWHQWDPMFENQTAGSIINALFPQANAHNIDVMMKLTPMEDVTLQADYVYLCMAKANSATITNLMNNDYGTAASASGMDFYANKKELGQELDVKLTYDYTEDVQFGLLAGWFFPGGAVGKEYLDSHTHQHDQMANEVITSVNVKF